MLTWPDIDQHADVPDVLEVQPGVPLTGRLRMPGDKSISHRALLLAAKAGGISTLTGLSDGDDVRRTALAVQAMGASLEHRPAPGDHERRGAVGEVLVTGGPNRLHEPDGVIDVGNSATGIRLLVGWVAAYPWLTVLAGDRSVARRPMARVVGPLRDMGAQVDGRQDGQYPPLVVRGGHLSGIDFTMPIASAQVKSAVLMAGLDASTPTTVHEPVPTRSHTEEMLALAGADIRVARDGLTVHLRPSVLRPVTLDVPGDPSQAAFWVVAASIVPGSDLTIERIYVGRARATFLDVLRRMGADVEVSVRDGTTADIRVRSAALQATTVAGPEVAAVIDEIPVLAVAATFAKGTTTFADAAELMVKETNRIETVTSGLRALGGKADARADGLVVMGGGGLRGGVAHSHGDHRVAMAMAVAGLAAAGPTRVAGWESVATSYPAFAEDLRNVRQ